MISTSSGPRFLRFSALLAGILFVVTPASAQWARINDVPSTKVFAIRAKDDTIAAAVDTAVYISTDSGKSWRRSAKPVSGVTSVQAVLVRNGRLYAGTSRQGVFISDDLGRTWQAFNQGLVGGILDSQLDLSDLEVRGDDLFAATLGAGIYARNLAGSDTWHHFGDAFEPNQASNVNDLELGGPRLLASAGSNGEVFTQDPGDADWAVSNLDNVGVHAGLSAQTAVWTGAGWVVGTVAGVFRSVVGSEPWTRIQLRLGPVFWTAFATQGSHLFAAFDVVNAGVNNAVIMQSDDDGATWQQLDLLPNVFVFKLALTGGQIFAGQADGLWVRPAPTATTSVTPGGGVRRLRFALTGAQPVGDHARLRFEMPADGTASIEVFDVLGRRVADRIQGSWSAGAHEVSLSTRGLDPGVYAARLTAAGSQEVVRMVRVR
jgi:hypothetical protein